MGHAPSGARAGGSSAVEGRRQHAEIQRQEACQRGERDPEDPRQRIPQPSQPRADQIKKKGHGPRGGYHGQGGESEEETRRSREVTGARKGTSIPLVPFVPESSIDFDVDELSASH